MRFFSVSIFTIFYFHCCIARDDEQKSHETHLKVWKFVRSDRENLKWVYSLNRMFVCSKTSCSCSNPPYNKQNRNEKWFWYMKIEKFVFEIWKARNTTHTIRCIQYLLIVSGGWELRWRIFPISRMKLHPRIHNSHWHDVNIISWV